MTRRQTMIYTRSTGDRVRVCDMHDRHLANALRALVREALVLNFPGLRDLSALRRHLPPVGDRMVRDLARRGIDPREHVEDYAGSLLREVMRLTGGDEDLATRIARLSS